MMSSANDGFFTKLQTRELGLLCTPVWIFDIKKLRFVWANAAALELWRAPNVQQLLERDVSLDISSAVKERLGQHYTDLKDTDETVSEHWTFFPNGEPKSYECIISTLQTDDMVDCLLIHAPVLSERLDRDTLYRANALLHSSVMVSIYNEAGDLQYANPAARTMQGSTRHLLSHRFRDQQLWQDVEHQLKQRESFTVEAEIITNVGVFWHRLTLEKSPDPHTGKTGITVTEFDVTDQYNAQKKVKKLAFSDPLTGLGNRTYLLNVLTHRVEQSHRAETSIAMLFLDVDRFKLINDSLGHSVGDTLLVEIAEIISRCVSHADLVARLGGDEFTVLFEVGTPLDQVVVTTEKIIAAMSTPLTIDDHKLLITPSIGISICPDHGNEDHELMRNADMAMYAAKEGGGGYRIYEPAMSVQVLDRVLIENDLRDALTNNEFVVHYQPKVSTIDGCIRGMEALVRWIHPTRGLIPPFDFIGIAEETGLIGKITEAVLKAALKQQLVWKGLGHDISIAINVSPHGFRTGGVVAMLQNALDESGVCPNKVELEITESMLMADSESVIETLEQIRKLGCKLSIDDFGTGYSNLSYLQSFPLDSIKIDRSFLFEEDRRPLLEMIIGIAHALNHTVVAEGVETEEQLLWLASKSCDEVQGYYFTKPLPNEEIIQYLKNYTNWKLQQLKCA